MNEKIKAPVVVVVSPEGKNIGVKELKEALKMAEDYGLDLVEVAPNANPPVCRIMDFGKYKYELEQKHKKSKKHQSHIVIKEIKMRPKIDKHDFEVKKKHVVRFLQAGAKVKVTIMFRGREVTHPELGVKLLNQLADGVKELGMVESAPKLDGRNMVMVLTALHQVKS